MVVATKPPVIMCESALPISSILEDIFQCGHGAIWCHEVLETTIAVELTHIMHGDGRSVCANIGIMNLTTVDDCIWPTEILKELVRWQQTQRATCERQMRICI